MKMEEALKMMNLDFCGKGMHKLSIPQLFENSKDVIFLDVRDINEVKALKFDLEIFGIRSINIPVNELPDRLKEIPADKTIACFCSSATRAAWAYLYLISHGYKAKWLEATNETLASYIKPGLVVKLRK